MTIPVLEGLTMETGEGKWRISCIGEPKRTVDSHRIDYHLRFKWVDQTNQENQATPERWLRLSTYKEDLIAADAEEKLLAALYSWLDWPDDYEARFSYESRHLLNLEE